MNNWIHDRLPDSRSSSGGLRPFDPSIDWRTYVTRGLPNPDSAQSPPIPCLNWTAVSIVPVCRSRIYMLNVGNTVHVLIQASPNHRLTQRREVRSRPRNNSPNALNPMVPTHIAPTLSPLRPLASLSFRRDGFLEREK